MITNNYTMTVPVGVTPDGETVTVDLRRNHAVLVAGIAGSGKSTLLRRMRGALEPQLDVGLMFHAEGIRANADDVILTARDEMRSRLQSRADDAAPAVLLVDDYGAMSIGRDRSDKSVQAIEEIAVKGRAAGMHLVLATQGREGLSGALLMNMTTRILVGRAAHPITRLFSDQERELITDSGTNPTGPGDGVLIGTDGRPTPFTALPL
ncbi:hypothetical protein [Mycolicibacterium austroafricanum]|uniref:hypothetical protein n=1 Tax=Mycolicibacterium austroafricanum TaxID=39687 RepID=UPI001CA344D6|nr:hypothetical protein [Mycolicibacterium austroafricanum]QZT56241.1 hypothetical protein JN084_25500 [Mycolicibacterium austroafricanum]